MPFTPVHTVVSLPFIRRMRAFSIFGLVIGSMAPDFEYFIRLSPLSTSGHMPVGFFMLNLPICIVVAILYMNIMEDGLLHLMPQCLASKWPRFSRDIRSYALAEWVNFIFWTIVGMITHITWDSFSHVSGFFVQHIALLQENVSFIGHDFPLYKVIQHGSSLIGLIILAVYIFARKSRKTPMPSVSKWKIRLAFIGITLALTGIRVFTMKLTGEVFWSSILVSIMSFSVLSWLAVSVIVKRNERRAVEGFLPS